MENGPHIDLIEYLVMFHNDGNWEYLNDISQNNTTDNNKMLANKMLARSV